MIKRYTSRSIPSFPVGGQRVRFIPKSTGGSYFDTSDEDLQKKMEAHPWFGSKFKLFAAASEATKTSEATAQETVWYDKGKAPVHFSTYADGKAYVLANSKGENAFNMRSTLDVLTVAKRHGIRMKIGDKKNYTTEEGEDH